LRDRTRFLHILRECGGLRGAACRQFGIALQTLLHEEERDPEFRELTDPAVIHAECFQDLEAEAYRRAMNGSDTLMRLLLAVGKPEKYSQRHLHGGEVHVNHDVTFTVIEDSNWYGRSIPIDSAAQSPAAPVADPALPSPVQAPGLRPSLGQNNHRSNGHDPGTRPDEGDVSGSN
jgi:hypothetical protein